MSNWVFIGCLTFEHADTATPLNQTWCLSSNWQSCSRTHFQLVKVGLCLCVLVLVLAPTQSFSLLLFLSLLNGVSFSLPPLPLSPSLTWLPACSLLRSSRHTPQQVGMSVAHRHFNWPTVQQQPVSRIESDARLLRALFSTWASAPEMIQLYHKERVRKGKSYTRYMPGICLVYYMSIQWRWYKTNPFILNMV